MPVPPRPKNPHPPLPDRLQTHPQPIVAAGESAPQHEAPPPIMVTRTFDSWIEQEAWNATCETLGYEPAILGVTDPHWQEVSHRYSVARAELSKLRDEPRTEEIAIQK